MDHNHPERRTFLRWVIHGMGAVFAAVLGVPAAAYLVDPRNRPASESGFRTVEGIKLNELEVGKPRQGVIRNVRWDAWTVHPSDVVGRVWVVKEADDKIKVFTTVCPHLGCSVNLSPATEGQASAGFTCPCHAAKFDIEGKVVHASGHQNPAPRGMDDLTWQIDPKDPDKQTIQVDYKNYYRGRSTKDVVA